MELYILRHGKAIKSASAGGPDADRRLTGAGREDIQKIACWLRETQVRIDRICTSPFVRAVETAGIVAEALRFPGRPELWESLIPGSEPLRLENDLHAAYPWAGVLLIGHEPMLGMLISTMIADGGTARVALRKGGLAIIDQIVWEGRLKGRLSRLIDPACL